MTISVKMIPIISIPLLLICGFVSASLPNLIKLSDSNKKWFGIANAFSGGVFLGAAFIHMLPDAADDFAAISKNALWMGGYPWTNLIAIGGFLFTLTLEQVLTPQQKELLTHPQHSSMNLTKDGLNIPSQKQFSESEDSQMTAENSSEEVKLVEITQLSQEASPDNSSAGELKRQKSFREDPSTLSALIFLVVLSVHAFITGLAVGGNNDNRLEQLYLLFALFVHKVCASAALGISFQRSIWTLKFRLKLLFGFSMSTPLGVAFGLLLTSLTQGQTHDFIVAFCTALGAGTFVYLAVMESIVEEFVENKQNLLQKIVAVTFGVIVMAILGFWA